MGIQTSAPAAAASSEPGGSKTQILDTSDPDPDPTVWQNNIGDHFPNSKVILIGSSYLSSYISICSSSSSKPPFCENESSEVDGCTICGLSCRSFAQRDKTDGGERENVCLDQKQMTTVKVEWKEK